MHFGARKNGFEFYLVQRERREIGTKGERDGKIVINRRFFMTEEREGGKKGVFFWADRRTQSRRLRLKPIKWQVERERGNADWFVLSRRGRELLNLETGSVRGQT